MGIIYKVTSPSNKVYIGKTAHSLSRRKENHYYWANDGVDTKFARALRKYGDSLRWEILHENVEEKELNKLEVETIKIFDSYKNGYNSTPGGEGHTGEFSEEHKKNLSISHLGQKPSLETRQKMSKNNSKYWLGKKRNIPKSVEILHKLATAEVHHNKGRKFSEEHKQKLKDARKRYFEGLKGE